MRVLYGAGLRVDPLSDNLVLQSCRDGWGDSYAYNWLFLLSNTGTLNTSFVVADEKVHEPNGSTSFGNGYYWFPSMPVFEDANKPQILLNQVMMGTNKKVEIDLSTKVVDYDNIFATMATQVELLNKQDQAKVSIAGNKLVIESQTQGNGYYWFPSMPVFEDANKPQILLNQVMMGTNKKVEIDLSTKVVDYDNIFATMATRVKLLNKQDQAKVSIAGNKLVIESLAQEGNCKLKLTVVSNGVRVEKEIELVIANEK